MWQPNFELQFDFKNQFHSFEDNHLPSSIVHSPSADSGISINYLSSPNSDVLSRSKLNFFSPTSVKSANYFEFDSNTCFELKSNFNRIKSTSNYLDNEQIDNFNYKFSNLDDSKNSIKLAENRFSYDDKLRLIKEIYESNQLDEDLNSYSNALNGYFDGLYKHPNELAKQQIESNPAKELANRPNKACPVYYNELIYFAQLIYYRLRSEQKTPGNKSIFMAKDAEDLPPQFNPSETRYCKFCKNNNEPKSFYLNHTTRNQIGEVCCPILSKHVCELCGSTGSIAHTRSYCPFSKIIRVNVKDINLAYQFHNMNVLNVH